MKIIRISFSDENFFVLENYAKEKKMSVQDYIRFVLFHESSSIFTPEEAEKRAKIKIEKDSTFSLPDLYDEEEWSSISRGEAGVFGRRFFKYIENSENIEFVDMFNRRARYRLKDKGEINDY